MEPNQEATAIEGPPPPRPLPLPPLPREELQPPALSSLTTSGEFVVAQPLTRDEHKSKPCGVRKAIMKKKNPQKIVKSPSPPPFVPSPIENSIEEQEVTIDDGEVAYMSGYSSSSDESSLASNEQKMLQARQGLTKALAGLSKGGLSGTGENHHQGADQNGNRPEKFVRKSSMPPPMPSISPPPPPHHDSSSSDDSYLTQTLLTRGRQLGGIPFPCLDSTGETEKPERQDTGDGPVRPVSMADDEYVNAGGWQCTDSDVSQVADTTVLGVPGVTPRGADSPHRGAECGGATKASPVMEAKTPSKEVSAGNTEDSSFGEEVTDSTVRSNKTPAYNLSGTNSKPPTGSNKRTRSVRKEEGNQSVVEPPIKHSMHPEQNIFRKVKDDLPRNTPPLPSKGTPLSNAAPPSPLDYSNSIPRPANEVMAASSGANLMETVAARNRNSSGSAAREQTDAEDASDHELDSSDGETPAKKQRQAAPSGKKTPPAKATQMAVKKSGAAANRRGAVAQVHEKANSIDDFITISLRGRGIVPFHGGKKSLRKFTSLQLRRCLKITRFFMDQEGKKTAKAANFNPFWELMRRFVIPQNIPNQGTWFYKPRSFSLSPDVIRSVASSLPNPIKRFWPDVFEVLNSYLVHMIDYLYTKLENGRGHKRGRLGRLMVTNESVDSGINDLINELAIRDTDGDT